MSTNDKWKMILPKLLKLVPLLSSDSPGEVFATANAIGRTLGSAGLDWHDFTLRLGSEPKTEEEVSIAEEAAKLKNEWQIAARLILEKWPHLTTNWEKEFLESIAARTSPLTEKQDAILKRIITKCTGKPPTTTPTQGWSTMKGA